MQVQKKLLCIFDAAFLEVVGAVWRLAMKLHPRPLQEWYAAREPSNGIQISQVFRIEREDAGQSLCRLGNKWIASEKNTKGLFPRNSLVKVFNKKNGHFAVLYVMGAGGRKVDSEEKKGMPFDGISLDYDACIRLGIDSGEAVDLVVGKANGGDSEFFHMYLDHDKSSRSARVLGWGLFAFGIAWSLVEIAQGLFAAFMHVVGLF